jgi:hypothetical protein
MLKKSLSCKELFVSIGLISVEGIIIFVLRFSFAFNFLTVPSRRILIVKTVDDLIQIIVA